MSRNRLIIRDLTPELIRSIRDAGETDPKTGIIKKITQARLAKLCGVTRVTVARWENKRKPTYPCASACRVIYGLMDAVQGRTASNGPTRLFRQLGRKENVRASL